MWYLQGKVTAAAITVCTIGTVSLCATENVPEAVLADEVTVSFQIVDLPSGPMPKGRLATGTTLTGEEIERLLGSKDVKVQSAPRITSRLDQAAQIMIVEEHSFVTGFDDGLEGVGWQPVTEVHEVGLKISCRVRRAPGDSAGLLADVEVEMSDLLEVMERKVTPPGASEEFILKLPLIAKSQVVTAVQPEPGVTTVVGGIEDPAGSEGRSTFILMNVDLRTHGENPEPSQGLGKDVKGDR